MEPLLPSLQNLPVFYTVLISLLLLFGLSGFSLYHRLRRQPPGPGIAWLKGLALLPLWLLCLLWSCVAVSMGVFAGAMAGSWSLPLSALGLLPLFVLLSWGYYRWIRGGVAVDAGALLLVPALVFGVYLLQGLWLCEPLAWSGLWQARLCTAKLYELGEGGAIRNEDTARDWYRQAAEQGVADAEYAVAGFTYEPEQKIDWYSRAADHGHADAAYQLYWLLERAHPAAALQRLQAAASQEHAGAQYRLGLLYRDGQGGVDRDLSRTRELWLRAASRGYISAMRALAVAYAGDAILFDYNPEASRYWEQQARNPGQAQPDIAIIEQVQEGNWENRLREIRERRARADAGDAVAKLAIGRDMLQQAGTDPVLIERAFGWIERAAQSGSVEAQYELANHLLEVEPAGETGLQWLLAAADGGHEAALRDVISAYKEETYGLPRDLQRSKAYSEALFRVLEARGVPENDADWMTAGWEYNDTLKQIKTEAGHHLPAAEPGQPGGAGDPAAMYRQGKELLSTRYAEGLALLTAAAVAGYPQAQYEMARSYRLRKHTDQEEQQAIDWLESAAQHDHRGAMVDLGVVYLQGIERIGLEPNPYRARLLFQQALRDREDTVYAEQSDTGRGWKYTVESVNHWLGKIPEAVMRLDLEGLNAAQRHAAIEQWYAREQQALLAQKAESQGEAQAVLQQQLEQLDRQYRVLSGKDREAAE
jgi:TPR repeat protein